MRVIVIGMCALFFVCMHANNDQAMSFGQALFVGDRPKPLDVYMHIKSQVHAYNARPEADFFTISLAQNEPNIGEYTAVFIGGDVYFRCHKGSILSQVPANGSKAAISTRLSLDAQKKLYFIAKFFGALRPVRDDALKKKIWDSLNIATRSAYVHLQDRHHTAIQSLNDIASKKPIAPHQALALPPDDFFVLRLDMDQAMLYVYNSENYQNVVMEFTKESDDYWRRQLIQP